MVLFYVIISLIFFLTSALLVFKPGWIKTLYLKMINNNLVMVYGVVEIAMALGIIYFKNKVKFSFIPLIIGIILFIDGILYVVFSSRKERLLTAILQIKDNTLRKMSFLTLIAAISLMISGLFVA